MYAARSIFAGLLVCACLPGLGFGRQEPGQLPEGSAPPPTSSTAQSGQSDPAEAKQNAAHRKDSEAAQSEAEKWLKLVDAGKYEASWEGFAPSVRKQVSEADWNTKISATRGSFGALESRKLQKSDYKTALPGAPDGEYVVVEYASSFAHKASTVETVILQKQTGAWRVAGYFMR